MDSLDSLAPFDVLSLARRQVYSLLKIALDNFDVYETDINARDDRGKTLLHILAEQNEKVLLQKVLDKKADVNLGDGENKTPLHVATEKGNLDAIRILLKHSPKLEIKDSEGETVVFKATRVGSVRLVKYLIQKGVNVCEKNLNGENLLHVAARQNNLEIVHFLLNATKLDVNSQDSLGETPLGIAVKSGSIDLVKFLIKRGANTGVLDKSKRSLLQMAVENVQMNIVRLLLASGVDINHRDCNGSTVLHTAAESKLNEMLLALVSNYRTDVNLEDEDGYTVLHLVAAAPEMCNKIAQTLINKGARINQQTFNGDSPLHRAASAGNLFVVNILTNAGCDINARNNDGNTATQLAKENSHYGVVHALEEFQKIHKKNEISRGRSFSTNRRINISGGQGKTKIPVHRSRSLGILNKRIL